MSRVIAGAQFIAIILIWLVAWFPMTLYCLLAFALAPIAADHSISGRRCVSGPLLSEAQGSGCLPELVCDETFASLHLNCATRPALQWTSLSVFRTRPETGPQIIEC